MHGPRWRYIRQTTFRVPFDQSGFSTNESSTTGAITETGFSVNSTDS